MDEVHDGTARRWCGMRLGIVGGKLQGTEATYLARKAGYQTVVYDRSPLVPAAGLADDVRVLDVTHSERATRAAMVDCDAVLPACEDIETLRWLTRHVPTWDMPLLFDLQAYSLSSSKLRSNELFDRLGVRRPAPWPRCGFPLIVKPSVGSGSVGVRRIDDEAGLEEALAEFERTGTAAVVEEYAPGPSLSLEVLAQHGEPVSLLPTLLEFDRVYDCKRVIAPVEDVATAGGSGTVDAEVLATLDDVSCRLARGLQLNGIMDVEVMVHSGSVKVLEIDARLPSQTPTAVYHCCGINMVSLFARTVLEGRVPAVKRSPVAACCYQHVAVANGAVEVLGEHVLASAGPLRLVHGLWGADEVLSGQPEEPSAAPWSATMICVADSVAAARRKAADAVDNLAKECGLTVVEETVGMSADDGEGTHAGRMMTTPAGGDA